MKIFLFLVLLFSPAAFANNNDEKAAEELAKELEAYQKQAEEVLNKVDKLLPQPGAAPGQMDKTKEKALKLANDDRFLKAAEGLWSSENRNKMLLIQAGFFLFMLILKAWRQSRVQHWFKRLLVGFFFSLITWIGLLYVIPLLVLGEPFGVFTGTLWRVLVMGQ